jgi:hypothetical protein
MAPKWTRERVRDAMRTWDERYGTLPSSYDWSRTHAKRRAGPALARLAGGDRPSPGTVTVLCGTWAAARADALVGSPATDLDVAVSTLAHAALGKERGGADAGWHGRCGR